MDACNTKEYLSPYQGTLILVNKNYAIKAPEETTRLKTFGYTDEGVQALDYVGLSYSLLINKLNAKDEIFCTSGYRSYTEQKNLFEESELENGIEYTQKYVALPGCSEHQTGLALDVALNRGEVDPICPDFPYEGKSNLFRKYAPLFGFIERYPKGKESITGIGHEPWHFRFVGTPHAQIITQNNFALEEYHQFLKQYRYGDNYLVYKTPEGCARISYIEAGQSGNIQAIAENPGTQISGNNVDGFIITQWEK